MCESILTFHAKNRYVERVGSRSTMKNNIEQARKFGLRSADIPAEYDLIKRFLGRNKIYYDGYVYIYESNNYRVLLTVYEYQDEILKELLDKKINNIKINNIKLEKMNLRQIFITYGNDLYNLILNYDKVASFYKVDPDNKNYIFPRYPSTDIHNKTTIFLSQFYKGKVKRFDFEVDYSFFTPEEKVVYRAIALIPYGQTITIKELLNNIRLEMSAQKLGKIIKECPIDYFIPTHRVVRSNGSIGDHREGKEFKKKLLTLEKETLMKEKMIKENRDKYEMRFEESLCYNICNLFDDIDS